MCMRACIYARISTSGRLSLSLSLYIYIYVRVLAYKEREREGGERWREAR
jgi:hypothetical protein